MAEILNAAFEVGLWMVRGDIAGAEVAMHDGSGHRDIKMLIVTWLCMCTEVSEDIEG